LTTSMPRPLSSHLHLPSQFHNLHLFSSP
jgi:hypothetical protein